MAPCAPWDRRFAQRSGYSTNKTAAARICAAAEFASRNADFSNNAPSITVLLISNHSWRRPDHLKLSAHSLNLLGLLLEGCGEGVNLPFLLSNPCLDLLVGLSLFE